jgi:hypothetical protein
MEKFVTNFRAITAHAPAWECALPKLTRLLAFAADVILTTMFQLHRLHAYIISDGG